MDSLNKLLVLHKKFHVLTSDFALPHCSFDIPPKPTEFSIYAFSGLVLAENYIHTSQCVSIIYKYSKLLTWYKGLYI